MLKRIQPKQIRARGGSFAIVASRYNDRYVGAMLRAAQAELRRAGAEDIQVVRVPGAYEIPIVAAKLAQPDVPRASRLAPRAPFSAIICLGVILRGETVHAAHIGDAVSRALMDIQLETKVPVIHEVLLLENEAQARARCLSRTHNRGAEAAQTALAMARVMAALSGRRR
jgi:6,7-dimethyl-8-ribityllumazine synthase